MPSNNAPALWQYPNLSNGYHDVFSNNAYTVCNESFGLINYLYQAAGFKLDWRQSLAIAGADDDIQLGIPETRFDADPDIARNIRQEQ